MSTFDSEFYRRFRPYYPSETFTGFAQNLKVRGFPEPFRIADIGCGTGHSTLSLLRTGITARLIGVEPDPRMLQQADLLIRDSGYEVERCLGTGENTGLPANSLDAVLIGSAFHWMDPQKSKEELVRILRPRGLIRIMEYQFPKAVQHAELNEWVRRQFNLFWKAPNQKPRGTFKEMMGGFKLDPRFARTASGSPPMIQSLMAMDLFGLLWSQSRVLCYLNTLDEVEKEAHGAEVRMQLEKAFEGREMPFDFKLQWIEFGLTVFTA
jgi:ubiquinone/menaquinone biosynthesis C-methylase UbiE